MKKLIKFLALSVSFSLIPAFAFTSVLAHPKANVVERNKGKAAVAGSHLSGWQQYGHKAAITRSSITKPAITKPRR